MARPYTREFRDDVVRVARNRDDGMTLEQIANDFGVHPMTLSKWLRQADIHDGTKPGTTTGDSAGLRQARRRRIKLLSRRTRCCAGPRRICRNPICRERLYPLAKELAADEIRVTVTCRVLKLARQPYYRWLANPGTDAEYLEAHRANAHRDAHRDDPEYGYRFLLAEAGDAGQEMAERTAWRTCSTQRLVECLRQQAWQERQARPARARVSGGPGFHRDAPNQWWLFDITEHRTDEGKLYLCAIKDVFSNRIVGYSIDFRMKSRLATTALASAATRRGDVAGCVLHSDRGSQGGFNLSSQHRVVDLTVVGRQALPSVSSSRVSCGVGC